MAACCCLTPSGRCAAASATKRRKSGSALVSWRMNQKVAPVGAFTDEKLKLLPDDTTTGATAVAALMRICAMCDRKLTNQLGEDQPNVFTWQPNAPCKPASAAAPGAAAAAPGAAAAAPGAADHRALRTLPHNGEDGEGEDGEGDDGFSTDEEDESAAAPRRPKRPTRGTRAHSRKANSGKRRAGKAMEDVCPRQRRRRFGDARAAVEDALEPSGKRAQRPVKPEDIEELFRSFGGGKRTITASVFNHMVYRLPRTDARHIRKVLNDEGFKIPNEAACMKERNSMREETHAPMRFIYEEGHAQESDGVTYELGELICNYIEQRDPDGEWLKDGRPILLALTNDGTNQGKAKKHSLQCATCRVLNQADGSRSCENTLIYSIARTAETKEHMEDVLKAQEEDVQQLVDYGLVVNGIKRDVIVFMIADEKSVCIVRGLASGKATHGCNYCECTRDKMTLLNASDAMQNRSAATAGRYAQRVAAKADELVTGWLPPFLTSQKKYAALQKFSSGTTVPKEYDTDNCRGQMGTPHFANSIAYEHYVPDVFHCVLHLINKFYEIVEDVARDLKGDYSTKLKAAMETAGMEQMHVMGHKLPAKKEDGQHRGFNGPEAWGWLGKVFDDFIANVFNDNELAKKTLKKGKEALQNLTSMILSVNWSKDNSGELRKRVNAYHKWMKDE
jgi:hypothetical protein